MRYSFIIPVYNRPDEVSELLASFLQQKGSDFEVIVVEDGSSVPCRTVCEQYADRLNLHYHAKPNSGPGQSRNYGAERAQGDYLVVLDSDIVLPSGYLAALDAALAEDDVDAWGGPDAANDGFTDVQKAISYSMTSFFTTGGIRGGKKKLDKFYPRSFNMGVRKDVWRQLGGFSKMRFGEDIDFSLRIYEAGYRCRLLPQAWVWHKRRTDFRKFWRQVFNSGIARINLMKRHKGSMRLVHLLPAAFTVGVVLLILTAAVGRLLMHYDDPHRWYWLCATPLLAILAYSLLIFADASRRYSSLRIGLLSVGAAFVQLMGYGSGFLQAWWRRCVRGKSEYEAYEKTFYK